MHDPPRVRLGLRLWPLRRFLRAHGPPRAFLALALLLVLAPWLPAPHQPAATVFPARSLSLPAGPPLVGVAIDPLLGRAFVADTADEVWALDERSGQLLGVSDPAIRGAGAPTGATAVDAVRHRLYFPTVDGDLAMVDGRSGESSPPWTLGPAWGVAIDGVADRVLVPHGEHAVVLAILDAGTGQPVATVPLSGPPGAMAVDAPARRIYIAAVDDARLDLLDADTYRTVATVALPGPADALAVDSTTHRVYAATAASGAVAVVDGRSGAALATLQAGQSPVALALNPATGHLFVADADAGNVAIVDTRHDAIVATVPVAGQPAAMAMDPGTGLVYVVSSAAGAGSALPSVRTVTLIRDDRRPPTMLAALIADLSHDGGRSDIGRGEVLARLAT